MLKQLVFYSIVFGGVFFTGLELHLLFLLKLNIKHSFSITNIYYFHALYTWFVCCLFLILSQKEKIAHQLGFLYLGSLMLKLILFTFIFYTPIFKQTLTQKESLSALIPMAIFLIIEVFFISKILTKQKSETIE